MKFSVPSLRSAAVGAWDRVRSRVSFRTAAAMAAYSAVLLLVGLLIGNWVSDNEIGGRLKTAVKAAIAESPWGPSETDDQQVSWTPLPRQPNLHYLERATIELTPFESEGDGGAIAEVGGAIVFAGPQGQLGYLSPDYAIHVLEQRVPMNLEALHASEIYANPRFVSGYFRVLDLLAVDRGAGRYDLFVSHHRFGDGCFEVVVSRIGMQTADGQVETVGDWDELFVTQPCMQTKPVDLIWGGLESGGRLVQLDASTLLLSVGDHQFDGVRTEQPAAQDPGSDLGKIIAIDLETSDARRFAMGFRNPQGLLVARDGTIWETEHGPQGGDEINRIVEGGNYGWPYATYGVDYGSMPRRDWPLNPIQGRHDGYEPPVFALVPSTGIGNIIQPDPETFPLWRDHLIVASLGGNENPSSWLYIVKVEQGRPVYAEPIEFENEELRDMIQLSDGRIAILTDGGRLLLLRRLNEVAGGAPLFAETGFTVRLDPAAAALVAARKDEPPLPLEERGRLVFASTCASCHAVDGRVMVGPPLNGVYRRPMGSVPGFAYSAALAGREQRWTEWDLIQFVMQLEPDIAGSSMPPPMLSYDDADAVAEYLKGF